LIDRDPDAESSLHVRLCECHVQQCRRLHVTIVVQPDDRQQMEGNSSCLTGCKRGNDLLRGASGTMRVTGIEQVARHAEPTLRGVATQPAAQV